MSSSMKPPGENRSSATRKWARVAPGAPVVLSQVEGDSFAAEQYRNLAFQVEQRKREQEDGSFVLATSSSDPGAGKTLTALNLALTLAREGERRVLLVEGDLWKPTFSQYLEIEDSTPGMAQVLAGESTVDDAVATVWGTELDVLWAGQSGRTTGLMAQRRLARVVEEMKAEYEVVVIDSPPVMLASGRSLADCADAVLVLVRAGQTKRRGIEEALSALSPDKVLGFVLNGARASNEKGYAYYAGYSRATEQAHPGDGRKRRWKVLGAIATAAVSVAAAYWLLGSEGDFSAVPELDQAAAVSTPLPEEVALESRVPSVHAELIAGARAAAAAVQSYDIDYVVLDYPAGDPGAERGTAADLVVRAFRQVGVDLQQEIHQDLVSNLSIYGALEPDRSIDHRRVRNLMLWFERHANRIADSTDWRAGDVVFWATDRPGWVNHVGIISDRASTEGGPQVIHHFKADNSGSEDDSLSRWPIVGHFRWTPPPGG